MAAYRILVVDNEMGMLEVCRDILKKLPDVDVRIQQDSLKAVDQLESENWDLLVSDIRMPGQSGVELLRRAREIDPGIASLMITAFPSVDTAVESMRLGASDYIRKPFLPDDLLASVRRLLDAKRLKEERDLLHRQIEKPYTFAEMIGPSPPMQSVFETIKRSADTNADVLITGETGTGKELVARSLHLNSSRSDQRFVPVDCGAIPDDLMESELFGHERGAFTGANARSLGLMEFAHRGTFFLDEIGELSVRMQTKLLRALQERKIRRLGGTNEIEVDVRVIAATARRLDEEIARDRFRSDLYYRINVVRIELPPLRERPEDIPVLTEHFIRQFARELNRSDVSIDSEAQEILTCYRWPGNVRELQNVIRRVLVAIDSDSINVDDLPDEVVATATRGSHSASGFFGLREQRVAAFESQYLSDLLETFQGDVSRAAEQAQIPRGTLYRLLGKYGMRPADYRP